MGFVVVLIIYFSVYLYSVLKSFKVLSQVTRLFPP
jgi:hypothetical protein